MAIGVKQQYEQAAKRLLLLDYDGTLREFQPTPELAKPTDEIITLLRGLTADEKNTVVIISGRAYKNLQEWLGGVGVHLVAEHGLAYRAPGQQWEFARSPSTAWQAPVRRLMDNAVSAAPGSFVRSKTDALVWHYRVAETDAANRALQALLAALQPIAGAFKLRILDGNKVLEVHPSGIDKGNAVHKHFHLADYDFALAIGDDVTDEDLFLAMPQNSHTVKVGDGATAARIRLPDPAAVRALLASFI